MAALFITLHTSRVLDETKQNTNSFLEAVKLEGEVCPEDGARGKPMEVY